MKINYNSKSFSAVSNSANGLVSKSMVFNYIQQGNVLTASYRGEQIVEGHLIGLVDSEGCIDMRYHQINADGELMTGVCRSIPEVLSNGKIRLHESWQWTSGDLSKGNSILEEL